nr:DUF3106 domain-containing protein [Caldimonas mangrovi]
MLSTALLAALACVPATAQPKRATAEPTVTEGQSWRELTPAQRLALGPLEREWPRIDAARKRKWLEIAARFPSMNAQERARLQDRMTEWARLSPQERLTARMNYREAKDVSPQERLSSWEAYQALSEDERRQLARKAARERAANAKKPAGKAASKGGAQQAKSASPPKPVAPAVLQARPGATTTSITKRPAPPWHQQPGMPKIAATPQFVDSHTLLPKVGPQAVAPLPAASAPRRK